MKLLTVTLLFLIFSASASAQIVVSSDELVSALVPRTNAAEWSSRDTNGLRALDALNGAGKIWDFTGRAYQLDFSGSYPGTLKPYPSGAALADDSNFLTATHVAAISEFPGYTHYSFIRITSEGIWELGESQDSLGVKSKVSYYSPPLLDYKLPLTYLSTWTGSSTYVDIKRRDTVMESIDGAVDGYGTLVLPNGKSQDALRVVIKYTDTPIHSSSSGRNEFAWYTKGLLYAKVSTDRFMRPSQIAYQEPATSGVELPTTDRATGPLQAWTSTTRDGSDITLHYNLKNEGTLRVVVMDALGRDARTFPGIRGAAGANSLDLDTHALPAGAYFVNVFADGVRATLKFIVP